MFHALVIKHHRYPTRPDEDGHAVPLDPCSWMVNLELSATVKNDGERSKRRPITECL
jgi:hypothetical protein